MADTKTNIPIPSGDWVDLYAAAGISVGVQLSVENVGTCDIYLAVQAGQPAPDHDAFNILKRTGPPMTNSQGDSGAWALCNNADGLLNITPVGEHGFRPSLPTSMLITDESDRRQMVSLAGESHVGFKVDDISVSFQYGLSNFDVREGGMTTGTGSVGIIKSTAFASTGLGVGSALLESVDSIRYRAGHETFCAVTLIFDGPEENVNQFAGFLDEEDGWCVGYQDLEFGLWFIEGGNINFIPQTDFNIDKLDGSGPSGYDINPLKGNWYRLSFIWHGFLDLMLEVRTADGRYVPAHKLVFINNTEETHLENPNLPMAVKIERTSGSGADLTIKSGSWRGGIIAGREEANNADRWFATFVVNRSLVTGQAHVLTIRSKTTFGGKINHIKALISLIVATNDSAKTLLFRGTRLEALDPADQAAIEAGFVDINTTDSVLEVSKTVLALTTPITDAQTGDVAIIQKNGFRDNLSVDGLNVFPGDSFVFITDSDISSGEVSLNLNIKELH